MWEFSFFWFELQKKPLYISSNKTYQEMEFYQNKTLDENLRV